MRKLAPVLLSTASVFVLAGLAFVAIFMINDERREIVGDGVTIPTNSDRTPDPASSGAATTLPTPGPSDILTATPRPTSPDTGTNPDRAQPVNPAPAQPIHPENDGDDVNDEDENDDDDDDD